MEVLVVELFYTISRQQEKLHTSLGNRDKVPKLTPKVILKTTVGLVLLLKRTGLGVL